MKERETLYKWIYAELEGIKEKVTSRIIKPRFRKGMLIFVDIQNLTFEKNLDNDFGRKTDEKWTVKKDQIRPKKWNDDLRKIKGKTKEKFQG